MKAMIFAAGVGSRLRPLTDHTPKALVKVGGTAMLERVIIRLKAMGADEIVINIHHLGGQIVDFLHVNNNFGLTIHVSDETALLLDTGGGLLHALPYLDGPDPVIVHNADIVTDVDLRALYAAHLDSHADATLLVARRDTSRYLLLRPNDLRLQGWINKKTGEVRPADCRPLEEGLEEWAFGGIHVLAPTLLRRLADEAVPGPFSIIPFYLSVCRTMDIRGLNLPCRWFDAGRPETLSAAEQWVTENE